MTVPVDPGTTLQDNVKEPILLAGVTGFHNRFLPLYNALSGALAQDNVSSALLSLMIGPRKPGDMLNVGITFGGTGNGTLTICQANGNAFADTDGNRGYVWMRSATNGSIIRGKIIANVTLSPVGMKPGQAIVDDLTAAILRLYAINDGNTSDDFTPKWGLCYQGGFQYIRNTQDYTTATNVTTPERFFVNTNISTDNSPVSDVGYALADLDYTGNVNGEKFWTFTSTRPGESADGVWQSYSGYSGSGFSAAPTVSAAWTMHGKTVAINYSPSASGTSNHTAYSVTCPIRHGGATYYYPLYNITDNSVKLTTDSYCTAGAGDTDFTLYPASNDTTWTAANSKSASFNFTYPAYQP